MATGDSTARAASTARQSSPQSMAGDSAQTAGEEDSSQPQKARTKRKKASRACFHCQKAHLTCDDGGISSTQITHGNANPCSKALSALRQARSGPNMPGRSAEKGQVFTRCGCRPYAVQITTPRANDAEVQAPSKLPQRPQLVKSESTGTGLSTMPGSFDASTPGDSSEFGAPLSHSGTVNMASVQQIPGTNNGMQGNYNYNFLGTSMLLHMHMLIYR